MSRNGDSIPSRYVRDVLHAQERPPPIAVRYFYASPFAIDDPLSPLPPSLASGPSAPKKPPQPFSIFDNRELDKTWLDVRKKLLKLGEQGRGEKTRTRASTITSNPGTPRLRPTGTARRNIYDPDSKRRSVVGQDGEIVSESPRKALMINEELKNGKRRSVELSGGEDGLSTSLLALDPTELSFPVDEPATTGRPFTRLPSRTDTRSAEGSRPRSTSGRPHPRSNDSYNWGDDNLVPAAGAERNGSKQKTPIISTPSPHHVKVPVGVSRLHSVIIPDLQCVLRSLCCFLKLIYHRMEPIYWLPVNDIATVIRGTWFYAENMLPVEPEIANLLESGYIQMQPWTETWKDELDSAVEVGALGEEKVLFKLWPDRPRKQISRPGTARSQDIAAIRRYVFPISKARKRPSSILKPHVQDQAD